MARASSDLRMKVCTLGLARISSSVSPSTEFGPLNAVDSLVNFSVCGIIAFPIAIISQEQSLRQLGGIGASQSDETNSALLTGATEDGSLSSSVLSGAAYERISARSTFSFARIMRSKQKR